jgi:hypothetical protein
MPEHGHQQRASQQRGEAGLKQRNGSAQRGHLSSSRHGSGNYAQQLDGHLSSSRQGSGNYAQQLGVSSGSNLANGSCASSPSTNLSPSAVQQLQAQKYPDFAAPACDPGMLQLPQQLRGAGMGNQADSYMGPAQGGDLQQVLQSLMAEVSASKQEAAQHIHVAEAAQQKLQLLQHLLGCSPAAPDACSPQALGAGVRAGSALSMTSGPSPVAAGWQVQGAAAQQLPAQGLSLLQLQALQQMLAHGSYDGVYPRRHSLDEAFLRRVQNLAAGGGTGFVGCGRPGSLWNKGSSASVVPGLAAVTEGCAMGNALDSSAAADIQALVAAFAASGLPSDSSGNTAGGLGSMQAAGLAPNSMLLGGPAGAGASASLGVPVGNSWMRDNGLVPWGQPGMAWNAGGAAHALPAGGFHSAPNLPPIPMAPQAISNGVSSFSMMHLQSQSDYLMQLQAMVQDSNAGLAGMGCTTAPRPVRASFDTAAAYLPSMPGDLLDAMSQGMQQAEVPVCADGVAGVSGGSSGSCKLLEPAPAIPDTLVNNPIGGAKQMGWF